MDILSLLHVSLFTNYKTCILSIGTCENRDGYLNGKQVISPLYFKSDVLIIALDEEYIHSPPPDILYITTDNSLSYEPVGRSDRKMISSDEDASLVFRSHDVPMKTYYNKEYNIRIIFIKKNIVSDYARKEDIHRYHDDFSYSFDCIPKNILWAKFIFFLLVLQKNTIQLIINNYAVYHSRSIQQGKQIYEYVGTKFEMFPELGYILLMYPPTNHVFITQSGRSVPLEDIPEFNEPVIRINLREFAMELTEKSKLGKKIILTRINMHWMKSKSMKRSKSVGRNKSRKSPKRSTRHSRRHVGKRRYSGVMDKKKDHTTLPKLIDYYRNNNPDYAADMEQLMATPDHV